jgi:hypothetical protein
MMLGHSRKACSTTLSATNKGPAQMYFGSLQVCHDVDACPVKLSVGNKPSASMEQQQKAGRAVCTSSQ